MSATKPAQPIQPLLDPKVRCACVFQHTCISDRSGKTLARAEVYIVIRRAGLRGWIGYLLRRVAYRLDGLESIPIRAATHPPVGNPETEQALVHGLFDGLQQASAALSRLQKIQLADQALERARPDLFRDANNERDSQE